MVDEIKMCWVDMETTGLDPEFEVPIEVGIKLTDEYGYVLAEQDWLVKENDNDFLDAVDRARTHHIVGPMHTKSGLFKDFDLRRDLRTRAELDDEIMDWLDDHGVKFGTLPMCGSSIGSLDRPFANVHFPKFSRTGLHYRNIDISSVKEICKLINPVLAENLVPIIGSKEDATHRVLDDIDASILEYRAYIENFFFVGD